MGLSTFETSDGVEHRYCLSELTTLPVHEARKAILSAEVAWANEHLAKQVKEDVMELVDTTSGPVRSLGTDRPSANGVTVDCFAMDSHDFLWTLAVECEECDGQGELTFHGKKVLHSAICEMCGGHGSDLTVDFVTDEDGLFLRWDKGSEITAMVRSYVLKDDEKAHELAKWMRS